MKAEIKESTESIISYVLISKLLTPIIDPGEQIQVEIYLTGSGELAAKKLLIILFKTSVVKKPEVYISKGT